MNAGRSIAAEALGTALLVAVVVGSGIMGERLAVGNGAIALLANTAATGAILFVLVVSLAPVSGAHFNPAVTLVAVLRRQMTTAVGAQYVAAQVLGAIAGCLIANAMFELPLVQLASSARTGPAQWLSEAMATFTLLLAIQATAVRGHVVAAAAVAMTITAGYWFTASTSFANPAVTVGRSLSDTFAGIAPADVAAFIVAQVAGAIASLAVASYLFVLPRVRESS